MYTWFINVLNALIRGLGVVLNLVLSLLPNSPFQAFLHSDSVVVRFLKYVNYIIPIFTFVSILEAYLVAVALFNLVQIIARWIKLIE